MSQQRERINPFTHPEALHCFLDLETSSTRKNAQILSIGAVVVSLQNPDDPILGMHYELLETKIPSGLEEKFHIDINTMAWWAQQSAGVRDQVFSPDLKPMRVPFHPAIANFGAFLEGITNNSDNLFMWGRGSDFDPPILEHAIQVSGFNHVRRQWGTYNNICHRTWEHLHKTVLDEIITEDVDTVQDAIFGQYARTPHIALNDAILEASKVLAEAYQGSGADLNKGAEYYSTLAASYNFPLKG